MFVSDRIHHGWWEGRQCSWLRCAESPACRSRNGPGSQGRHARRCPRMSMAASPRPWRPLKRLLAAVGQVPEARPRVQWTAVDVGRGRVAWVPSTLPRLSAADALRRVALPLDLNWSQPGRLFDLRDRADRARAYESVSGGRPRADHRRGRWGAPGRSVAELVLPRAAPGMGRADPGDDGPTMSGLTDFQVQVARIFFALPESAGFLVAGGAALIAQELVERETRDLTRSPHPGPASPPPSSG